MAPKKRTRAEPMVLDLTNDDDDVASLNAIGRDTNAGYKKQKTQRQPASAPSSKHSTAAPSQSRAPPTQEERDSWADGAASTEMIDLSQAGHNTDTDALGSLRLYGTVHSKVVGVRYYRGVATIGEFVLVKREPGNQYDSNAVRIDNVAGEQIGHVPRQMAAKLAPFLDAQSLAVEARLASGIGHFDADLDLALYGTSDTVAAAALKKQLQEAKLPVTGFNQEERERKKRDKEEKAAAAERRKSMLKKAANKAGTVKGDGKTQFEEQGTGEWANITVPTGEDGDGISMDTILERSVNFDPRELGKVAEKYGTSEEKLSALPMAEQPKDLKTKLLPYQRQGLAWMLDRENPRLPTKPSDDAVQLWKKNANGTFTNIATSFTTKTPRLASGGLLADDMGLGKTIQVISLLASDSARAKQQPTLIVCPLSVMSNWTGQAAAHMKVDKALKTLIYHGDGRRACQKPADFAEYDVVVTTYQTMSLEYMPAGNKGRPQSVPRANGLFSVDWRRVVLDEGHHIRNPKTKTAQAAYNLPGRSRWILSGTPIVNNLRDLQSHVRFIGLAGGLEQAEVFSGTLMRPLSQGREEAKILLQALMSTICLRRMKDMDFIDLRLPAITSHKYTIELSVEEQRRYDAFADEAKGLLVNYQTRKNAKGETTYSHLLEVLLRMRQTCNHWQLCGERSSKLLALLESRGQADADEAEHVRALQGLLQLAIESHDECCVCLETLHRPAITRCAHVFGHECIERVIETQRRCPMCRAEVTDASELIHPATEFGDGGDGGGRGRSRTKDGTSSGDNNSSNDNDIKDNGSSSKLRALLDILRASAASDTPPKTVVFSQWTSFLDLVGAQLDAAGIAYCRLDGTMNAEGRDASMRRLADDDGCRVMLASLGVCSVGLNLVAASQVVLCDSWWAPAVEDQAVDRVHRLGQTRAVRVLRLVAGNSIEERVLELQAQKRQLASAAFGDDDDQNAGDERRGDDDDTAAPDDSGRRAGRQQQQSRRPRRQRRGQERSARLADIETLLR